MSSTVKLFKNTAKYLKQQKQSDVICCAEATSLDAPLFACCANRNECFAMYYTPSSSSSSEGTTSLLLKILGVFDKFSLLRPVLNCGYAIS